MAENLQQRIDEVVNRYKPQIEQLKKDGEQIASDFEEPSTVGATVGVDFKIEWARQEISFDLPSVTMDRHEISFDVPAITMKTKKIIFDRPDICMKDQVVGYKPEVRGFPPQVRMTPIIVSIPVPCMKREEISFDIPEVTSQRQELSFDVPKFRMNRTDWSFDLPQFTIINVRAETDRIKEKGDDLKRRAESIKQAMMAEIQNILNGGASSAQDAIDQRQALAKPFNDAVAAISGKIDELVAKKIDPVKIPAEGGNINLRKLLSDVVAQREAALEKFDSDVKMIGS